MIFIHSYTSYLNVDQEISQLLDFCRWVQIPIGSIEDDRDIQATEIFYSRLLKAGNAISWYSPMGRPDLGGVNDDDFRKLIPTDCLSSSFTQPGLYLTYCVEIEIQLLVLNTIFISDELKNIDKEVGNYIVDSNNHIAKGNSKIVSEAMKKMNNRQNYLYEDLDELTTSKTAFKYLKVLVGGWL